MPWMADCGRRRGKGEGNREEGRERRGGGGAEVKGKDGKEEDG